jgi:hypothetical protein
VERTGAPLDLLCAQLSVPALLNADRPPMSKMAMKVRRTGDLAGGPRCARPPAGVKTAGRSNSRSRPPGTLGAEGRTALTLSRQLDLALAQLACRRSTCFYFRYRHTLYGREVDACPSRRPAQALMVAPRARPQCRESTAAEAAFRTSPPPALATPATTACCAGWRATTRRRRRRQAAPRRRHHRARHCRACVRSRGPARRADMPRAR